LLQITRKKKPKQEMATNDGKEQRDQSKRFTGQGSCVSAKKRKKSLTVRKELAASHPKKRAGMRRLKRAG